MRILILANIDLGLYKFRRELLQSLVREHEVYFCVPQGEYVEKLSALGCRFIPCNLMDRRGTNPVKDLKLIRFYRKLISTVQPELVLTYTIKPNVYGGFVCGLKKVPYIVNVTGLGTTIENGGLLGAISLFLYRIGLKKANCVFFQNSENQKLFLKKRIVKDRVRLIPGSGVNLETHCYEAYPDEKNGIHFLFVGRIMKDKGIGELLQAIHVLHSTDPNVVLDVVGWCDEDYSSALKQAEQAGEVVYHGLQSDVHPFYTRCHCAVLPSYHEGMANVMLEASATGRPVITTRVPGCKETFDEGVTGFGCEAKDPDSLVDAMRRFLALNQSQRILMGKAAREKMYREYNRSTVIDSYLEEIQKIQQMKYTGDRIETI